MDLAVRAFTVVLGTLIVIQLFGRKGDKAHVRFGIAALAFGILTLIAVTTRGVMQLGMPHGALYPVHVVLGCLCLASLGVLAVSGFMMRRYESMRMVHKIAAGNVALSFVLMLAAGIASLLMKR